MSWKEQESEVRGAFQELRKERGLCPSAEDLIRFQQFRMPAEEMTRTKQHVEVCGKCDWELAGLLAFDSAMRKEQTRTWMESLRRFAMNPAFAYALVLLLLYPAYRGLFQEPQVVEKTVTRTEKTPVPVEQIGSAREFDLGEARRERGNDASIDSLPRIHLGPADKFLILNFFQPVRPSHRYEMRISDASGKAITAGKIQSKDDLGNFSVVATTGLFPDGIYSLKVREFREDSSQALDEYVFQFRVTRET